MPADPLAPDITPILLDASDLREASQQFAKLTTAIVMKFHQTEFGDDQKAAINRYIDDPELIYDEMNQSCVQLARDGMPPMMWLRFYARTGFMAEIGFPARGGSQEAIDAVKEMLAACAQVITRLCDIDLYVSSQESWLARVDNVDPKVAALMPRDREDRMEVVAYLIETKTRQTMRFYDIERDANGEMTGLTRNTQFDGGDKLSAGGRFANLLFDNESPEPTQRGASPKQKPTRH